MIFTAYLDESGTHAGAKVSAMGGHVASARQWRKYGVRTYKLFKRYGVKNITQSTCGAEMGTSRAGR